MEFIFKLLPGLIVDHTVDPFVILPKLFFLIFYDSENPPGSPMNVLLDTSRN